MDAPDPYEMSFDVCAICGITIGYGIRILHLGICEDCRDLGAGEDGPPAPELDDG